jgi:hypothetical protein
MVQLDMHQTALVADGDAVVQPTVPDAQVVEYPQRLPCEPAEFGVVPLGLQFADHYQRQDHLVLAEAGERAGVGQQD